MPIALSRAASGNALFAGHGAFDVISPGSAASRAGAPDASTAAASTARRSDATRVTRHMVPAADC